MTDQNSFGVSIQTAEDLITKIGIELDNDRLQKLFEAVSDEYEATQELNKSQGFQQLSYHTIEHVIAAIKTLADLVSDQRGIIPPLSEEHVFDDLELSVAALLIHDSALTRASSLMDADVSLEIDQKLFHEASSYDLWEKRLEIHGYNNEKPVIKDRVLATELKTNLTKLSDYQVHLADALATLGRSYEVSFKGSVLVAMERYNVDERKAQELVWDPYFVNRTSGFMLASLRACEGYVTLLENSEIAEESKQRLIVSAGILNDNLSRNALEYLLMAKAEHGVKIDRPDYRIPGRFSIISLNQFFRDSLPIFDTRQINRETQNLYNLVRPK